MVVLKTFFCTYCGIWESSLDRKRRHVIRHQNKYRKIIRPRSELQSQKNRPHMCTVCKTCFPSLKHLEHHKIIHTNVKLFWCKYCKKCFSGRIYLKRHHIRFHATKVKLYHSEALMGDFKMAYVSYDHDRAKTHCTIEKPLHECEYCQKCFAHKCNLTLHIRTHTKEKPYQCEYCQKCFAQKVHLQRHIKTHTKEKP